MANNSDPDAGDQSQEDLISADELAALTGLGSPPAVPAGTPTKATGAQETLGDLISADELAALTGQSTPAATSAPAPSSAPGPKPAAEQTPAPAAPRNEAASTFEPIAPEDGEAPAENSISLLMDVPLRVSIELGRVVMTVQQLLGLGRGSIVELDRLAGEPVDILVNDKPIGRGEVVVIDENFGVKITELFEPKG
jgi:flagellar motor switch protein FliN/FliY